MADYFFSIYLAIPAFIANMLPVVFARLNIMPFLAKPIDGGKLFFGERILGDHKTWRGFIIGILGAGFVAVGQLMLAKINLITYPLDNIISVTAFGLLAGLGALGGDALKSFFKRRVGIKSGRPFIPFDQIDYLLGFLILTSLIYSWSLEQIIFLLVFGLIANPLVNIFSYVLGIKPTFW